MSPLSRIATAAFVALFPYFALADFYLEPYTGYEVGSYRMNNPAFPNGNMRGLNIGGRVGGRFLNMFFVALDGRYGALMDSPNVQGSVGDGDVTAKSMGATVGIDFPVLLRAWAGYNWLDQMEYATQANALYTGYSVRGSSTKLGIGFSPVPLFSLNVEYIVYNHTHVAWAGGVLAGRQERIENSTLGDLSRDHSAIFLNVSLPLSLPVPL